MINFSSKKTKGIISKVIVIVLAIAMVLSFMTPLFS